MMIQFTKMHGLGNDFVVINAIAQQLSLTVAQIRHITDRHFGVGCDQVLLVEAARSSSFDFTYRIFNADGGEVEQCGNGARCFARYVFDKGLTRKSHIRVETSSGELELTLNSHDSVTVNMGVPEFEPAKIPFNSSQQKLLYNIILENNSYDIAVVSIGNPHAILQVTDIEQAPLQVVGATMESSHYFPQRVNVGFMQIVDRQHIRLRVFERGVGETLACGSGACAAVVCGIQQDLLDNEVEVHLGGGDLKITWRGNSQPVMMNGAAATVFEGQIEL